MPPRAAETNEPLTYVGAAGAGSSGAGTPGGANGGSGSPMAVFSIGGVAPEGSNTVDPSAYAPAAPTAAPAPRRRIVRRLTFCMLAIMPLGRMGSASVAFLWTGLAIVRNPDTALLLLAACNA